MIIKINIKSTYYGTNLYETNYRWTKLFWEENGLKIVRFGRKDKEEDYAFLYRW